MSPERWHEIKRIFDEIVDLPAAERSQLLAETCAHDEEMRSELEQMLAADADPPLQDSPFFQLPDDDPGAFKEKRIGRYLILEEIGRGGMGAVFSAVRADGEFDQKVALKIINSGLNTNVIVRRFRHERQILASLEHPHIAHLIDGGVSDTGVPFYVMEFVEGVPLDEYCRDNGLTLSEKLELFRQVCDAVSYAHGRLIVHRDLKPSNILVKADGQVKLLDFGIAKVLSQDENGAQHTATQLGMMTPNYASPEQIRGASVTTSTDVYSLGVVLYQLLTGSLPYDLSGLRLDEMLKIVSDTEPARPSDAGKRVAEAREPRSEISDSRSQTGKEDLSSAIPNLRSQGRQVVRSEISDLRSSASPLRGDLDNIVLKALRKEPAQRYASVEQFSEDIRRYLAGLPVVARRATFGYKAGKFIRRNRIAVGLSALLLLILLGGITATGWQAVRADRARKLAEKRSAQSRDLANSLVFKYHDAIANLPNSSPVREMLLKDASAYLDELAQDAGDDMTLRREVASAFMKLGDIQGRPNGESIGNTAGALASYDKAAALFENVAQYSTGPERAPANRDLLAIYQRLRTALARAREQPERREQLRLRRIAILEQMLKERPADLSLRIDLAEAHKSAGNRLFLTSFDEGDQYYRQFILPILADAERVAPANPATLEMRKQIYSDLGWYFAEHGRWLLELEQGQQAAQPYFEKALELFRETAKVYEAQFQSRAPTMDSRRNRKIGVCNVGIALGDSGRVDESFTYLQDCFSFNQELIGFDAHNLQAVFDLGDSYNSLAIYYRRKREYEQSLAHFRPALAQMEKVIASDSKHHEAINYKLELLVQLGNTSAEAGRLSAALQYYEQAKTFAERSLTDEPSDRVQLGRVYLHEGRSYIRLAEQETAGRAREYWEKAQSELLRAAEIIEQSKALASGNQLRIVKHQLAKCERALAG